MGGRKGVGDALQYQAFAYGRHVGLAFQLVDDVLDFEQTSETLGKPALNDLRHGLATAPVLLAARTFPDEVGDMVKRKFASEGDVERVREMAFFSIAKTLPRPPYNSSYLGTSL